MWNELKKMAAKEQTVVVDVDGTIFTYDKYEKNKFGEPINQVIDKLREIKKDGNKLILSTARDEDEKEALVEHLKKHEIYGLFDVVECGKKQIARAYIDDRAINPLRLETWKDDLDELLKGEGR